MTWRGGRLRALVTALAVAAVGMLMITAPGATGAGGPPIVIGFLNQERGPVAFPDFGSGARVARGYVNSQLKGIRGRQLRFVECLTDGSPEASIDCANRFVEAKVVAVLMGIDLGSDAALPILTAARIPLVGHRGYGAAQFGSKNAFFFGAPVSAFGAGPLKLMARRMGVNSVVYISLNNPVTKAFVATGLAPAAKKLGIELDTVFYNPVSPDFTQIVTTALATRPEALFFSAAEPDCTGLVASIRQLRYGGRVFAGGCSAFISADRKAAEGVLTANDLWVTSDAKAAPKAKAAELKTFVAQMRKGAPKYAASANAQATFSSTMDVANILRLIKGRVTSAALVKQLRKTRRLPSFMGQPITCDGKQWPGQVSACAGGILAFRVRNGVRRVFTNGFVYAKDVVGP